MEIGSERSNPSKPIVIFHDCCVPVNHIESLASEFPQAQHLFVNKIFSRIVCSDDRELFLRVCELSQNSYPDGQIFFLTLDQSFLQNISDLEVEDSVRVVVMESVSSVSFETAIVRVKAALQLIFDSCSYD